MKNIKLGLRVWITLTSVASFMVGWVMLVHAPKPAQFSMNVSTPKLAPLPPLSDTGTSSVQPFFNVQPQRRSFFRTGGS
jgi:hypothetical protein